MLLPCPHCKRQFGLLSERIRSERVKIKCPACNGLFRVNFTPRRSGVQERPPREALEESPPPVTRSSLGIYPKLARLARDDRSRPRFLMFWAVAPACFVFLSLTGIFLSGPRLSTDNPGLSSLSAEINEEASHMSLVSSQPKVSPRYRDLHPETSPDPAISGRHPVNSIVEAFWSSAPPDPKSACAVLNRSQAEWLAKEGQDSCKVYPLWITYLLLDFSPAPVCEPEHPFVLAVDAIRGRSLCGPGHAFLCAYYLSKRLPERSQSYLDEALRLTPHDPWVKLVEAVFHERVTCDDQKAIHVLEELNQQHPCFPLARYLLGKTYIRQEDYRRASKSFQSLREGIKGQVAFWRIRRALSSLEQTDRFSVEKAEGLLAMSRAFATLGDFPMAEHVYRRILKEMPERLPNKERMAAYCELGRIYEQRGDRKNACDAYRNALDVDPEFPDARERIRHFFPCQADHS